MRATAIFFSFYMLLLVLVPCMDRDSSFQHTQLENTIQIDHSNDKAAHPDSCSPFCTCACCASVRIAVLQNTMKINRIPQYITYATVVTPAVEQAGRSFWQPPKFG